MDLWVLVGGMVLVSFFFMACPGIGRFGGSDRLTVRTCVPQTRVPKHVWTKRNSLGLLCSSHQLSVPTSRLGSPLVECHLKSSVTTSPVWPLVQRVQTRHTSPGAACPMCWTIWGKAIVKFFIGKSSEREKIVLKLNGQLETNMSRT